MDATPEITLTTDKQGVLVSLVIKPRSRANAILGIRARALSVSVTAAPIEGAANAAVLEVLAEALRLPKSRLSLAQGHKSRQKVVRIADITLEDVRSRLSALTLPQKA